MTVKLPDGIRTAVSPDDGTTLLVLDARDDEALEQGLAASRFAASLLPQPSTLGVSPPETVQEAIATMRSRRPRGVFVNAMPPVKGRFLYWVAWTNFAMTDAEVDHVCQVCASREVPEPPTVPGMIKFGNFELRRAEIQRAVRSSDDDGTDGCHAPRP